MSIQYVFCSDHKFIRQSACPSIALSCYNTKGTLPGEIGFAFSEEAESVRRQLILGAYYFGASDFYPIGETTRVDFPPGQETDWRTATIICQKQGALANRFGQPLELSAGFRKDVARIMEGKVSIHKDLAVVNDLAKVHVEYGLQLQFWPFLTPYEDVCYLYSASLDGLKEQLLVFFDNRNLSLKEVDWMHFPVY